MGRGRDELPCVTQAASCGVTNRMWYRRLPDEVHLIGGGVDRIIESVKPSHMHCLGWEVSPLLDPRSRDFFKVFF